MVPLGRASTSKDAELLILGYEVAVLRRTDPKLALNWNDRAIFAHTVGAEPDDRPGPAAVSASSGIDDAGVAMDTAAGPQPTGRPRRVHRILHLPDA